MNLDTFSAVVIHYGDPNLLYTLLNSLESHQDCHLISEFVIVNNGLTLDASTLNQLKKRKYEFQLRIVDNKEKSYSSGVNAGASSATQDSLLIMNNDIEWSPDYSIKPLLESLHQPNIGVVGPQLVFPDGSWQRSYGSFPSIRYALSSVLMLDTASYIAEISRLKLSSLRNPFPVDYVDGAFFAVSKKCFFEVGGFDTNTPFYSEDADFCYRVKLKGLKNLIVPKTRMVHLRGSSSSQQAIAEYSRKLMKGMTWFVRKHGSDTQARLYFSLYKFAMLERAVLFTTLSKYLNSPRLQSMASIARTKHSAITAYPHQS